MNAGYLRYDGRPSGVIDQTPVASHALEGTNQNRPALRVLGFLENAAS